jgi:hypothetical protein
MMLDASLLDDVGLNSRAVFALDGLPPALRLQLPSTPASPTARNSSANPTVVRKEATDQRRGESIG